MITGDDLMAGLFNALYDATLIPLLPSIIDALLAGDTAIVPALIQRGVPFATGAADAMTLAVDCADNAALDTADADAAAFDDPGRLGLLAALVGRVPAGLAGHARRVQCARRVGDPRPRARRFVRPDHPAGRDRTGRRNAHRLDVHPRRPGRPLDHRLLPVHRPHRARLPRPPDRRGGHRCASTRSGRPTSNDQRAKSGSDDAEGRFRGPNSPQTAQWSSSPGAQRPSRSRIWMRSRFSYVTSFAGSGLRLNVRNVMSVVSIGEDPPDQRLAEAEQDLDRLERLDRADDAGQHAEHAGLGAARGQLGRRRLGHHVAVGRALAAGGTR